MHLTQGRLDRAVPWLERSRGLERQGGFAFLFAGIASWLGRAWALTGRIPEAAALLEEATRRAASTRRGNAEPFLTDALAEVHLAAGRLAEARASARAALAGARAQRQPWTEVFALWHLGEIHARSSPPESEDAEESYRAALAIADRLGLRPLIAQCHLGLGKLHRRIGRPGEAQEHLATAAATFREMDMPDWLEQAETELRRP